MKFIIVKNAVQKVYWSENGWTLDLGQAKTFSTKEEAVQVLEKLGLENSIRVKIQEIVG